MFYINQIILSISCFFLFASCNSQESYVFTKDQWIKLEENSESVKFKYCVSDQFVHNYFKDSLCYHEGWITCPYIKGAIVTFYMKENITIVSDIVFKSSFTLPNEIETVWSKKNGGIAFEFGIPFLSYPSENLFPW